MIETLTEVACTDNGTLLHNFKHLNSMIVEFYECTGAQRWNFLMQGAKFVAWYCGLTTHAHQLAEMALQGEELPD